MVVYKATKPENCKCGGKMKKHPLGLYVCQESNCWWTYWGFAGWSNGYKLLGIPINE